MKVLHHLTCKSLMAFLILSGVNEGIMAAEVKITLYNKIMASANMGLSGQSTRQMGDGIAAHMNVYGSPDLTKPPVATGDFSLMVTVPATIESPVETRIYHAIFTFNARDSVVVDGISLANMPDNWMNSIPSSRAITGGTGRYNGAKGTAVFTRIEQNLFKMDLKFRTN